MDVVAKKTGRNEPCPCGSGKKHKKCCQSGGGLPVAPDHPIGVRPVAFDEVPESVRTAFLKQQLRQAERVTKYGHVRPPISADFQGHKLVVVGNRLIWAKNWKTFHDFLFTYIAAVLAREWGNEEIKKPYADRHPLLQWYQQLCDFQRVHVKPDGAIYSAVASGPERSGTS